MNKFGNVTGAFADVAMLFPLLVALSLQTNMKGAVLLATTGIAYIMAGFMFRVPMAVQPLKSVVVMALALNASATEISLSGFAVGIVCLMLSFCYADKLTTQVPRHLVHGLQLALGIMLIVKGSHCGISESVELSTVGFVFLTLWILIWSAKTDQPIMGWVATLGLLLSLILAFTSPEKPMPVTPTKSWRFDIILALVLPQLALTLSNSVVGTQDVAERYFGQKAKYVTPSRLLRSIGLGNIFVALFGGLPFCHGSGGVTAHVKGGATGWIMNVIMGSVLISLALLSWFFDKSLIPAYPKVLLAALLFTTGWFHIQLAARSWMKPELRWVLVIMALVMLLTQNMLWTLAAGIMCEFFKKLINLSKLRRKYDHL